MHYFHLQINRDLLKLNYLHELLFLVIFLPIKNLLKVYFFDSNSNK